MKTFVTAVFALLINSACLYAADGQTVDEEPNESRTTQNAASAAENQTSANEDNADYGIPEFLHAMFPNEPLPRVPHGHKVVTVRVSPENWLELGWGDRVSVDVEIPSPDVLFSAARTNSKVRLVENAPIYAIPNFATEDGGLVPVCLLLTLEQAQGVLTAVSHRRRFELSVVEQFNPVVSARAAVISAGAEETRQLEASTFGTYIQLTPGKPQTIEMHDHEVCRVSLEKRIKSVGGFNRDVVEVTASGANGLRISSSHAGGTRLTIVDEDNEPLELTVIVSQDMTDLELLLGRLYPDADIKVVPIHDSVLLRGTVEDKEQLQQIEEIAGQFAPQVLNQLHVAGVSSSAEIPAGYRVVTLSADVDVDVLEPGDFVDVIVWYNQLDDTGVPVRTITKTLVSGVEVFSVKTRTIGVGGAQSAQEYVAALLLRPDEAEALKFIQDQFQSRCIQLVWRAAGDVGSDSRFNREYLAQLRRHLEGERAPIPEASPVPPPVPDSESDLQSLRDDIRALHEDVRRLIKVLEDRQERERHENSPAAPDIKQGAAMLYFDAKWCGVCERMRPIVSRLTNDGLAVRTVDVDEDRNVARKYNVTAIPAFVSLYDGQEIEHLVGETTENELRGLVARASSPQDRSGSESPNRTWTELGMRLEEVVGDDAQLSGSPFRGGMKITEVREGSPANAAGLRTGDVLVGLHVWETTSAENVEYVLRHPQLSSFTPLKYYVLRNGETLFGHFAYGERTNLPRLFDLFDTRKGSGVAPPGGEAEEPAANLVPLPAGGREPGADPEG